MRNKVIRLLAVNVTALVLLGVFARAAYGQVSTGELTGTVTDAKGAAMSGVSVAVHNADTGVDSTPVTTSDSGTYDVPLLQPGNYDVTASQTGFSTVQHKGITIQVGQTVRIDVEMPVASQQSLVTVTTEAPVLETEKTEQSQNVSENLVSNLPVGSRRWEQFVQLTPGLTPDGSTGSFSFHGINSSYNSNSVDGANNNSLYNGSARGTPASDGYVYSGDSIREFQVEASNFTAEIGQSAGGAVNAVTKSGTNQFHGDLFENLRNPIFNALDPVAKASAAVNNTIPTQPVHQQNQYGGSVGGPIVKDKLFFFVTYDGYRKVFPNTSTSPSFAIVPGACPTIITSAQCNAAVNYVIGNIVNSFPQNLRQDVELAKLDYQLDQSNHLDVVANIRDWDNPRGGNGNAALGSQKSFLQDRFVIANWTSLISTDKVNEVRYQWGIDAAFSPPAAVGGAPGVTLTGLFSYGSNNGSTYTKEPRNQITDSFSYTKGTHTFKMGVDLNFVDDQARSAINSAGAYTYSTAVTLPAAAGCPSTASSAVVFCDWLVDLYGVTIPGDTRPGNHWSSYTQDVSSDAFPTGSTVIAPGFALPDGSVPPQTFSYNFNSQQYAVYFQDTWKVRSNITLNLGLRYDVQAFPPPIHPNTLDSYIHNLTESYPTDYGGIGPRLGVAYNIRKNTVLRAGGGVFVAPTVGSLFKAFNAGGDEAQVPCNPTGVTTAGLATCSAVASQPAGTFKFPDVFVAQQNVHPSAPFASSTLGGTAGNQPLTPTVLTPTSSICPCGNRGVLTGTRPRAYEAQVAVEQQLPGNMNLSVTYVFTRANYLPSSVDINILNNGLIKNYDVVNSSGATQFVQPVSFFDTRVDPAVGTVLASVNNVNSVYNGMVVTLRKPLSHGIELLANYTLSKATDDGQAGNGLGGETFLATDGVLNPFNQKAEEGYSQTNVPNRFTASVVWQPMYVKSSSSRLVRALANGWNLSTTVTATNGTYYSGEIQGTSAQCLVVATTCPTGDLALEGGLGGADISTSFTNLGGRIAWMPRDSYELPNYSDVDLRLARQFTIHERYAFEFRAETFNTFNSTIVQAVNQNAYNYAAPSATSATCPSSTHTNTCLVPNPPTTFQVPSTTLGTLLGPRQLQFGLRFDF